MDKGKNEMPFDVVPHSGPVVTPTTALLTIEEELFRLGNQLQLKKYYKLYVSNWPLEKENKEMQRVSDLIEQVVADVLFNEMSEFCAKSFAESNATTINFSQTWFDATFTDDLIERRGIPHFDYDFAEQLLRTYFYRFQKHLSDFALKCVNTSNLSMGNVTFEHDWDVWVHKFDEHMY